MLPGADNETAAADVRAPDAGVAAIPTSMPAAATRRGLSWWLSLVIVALDQITKWLIARMIPLYDSKEVIPGMMDLVHVRNTGVAFGFLNDLAHPNQSLITTTLAVAALVGIAYYARHIRTHERWARLGLSLILGGAIGNLIDRVRFGFVIDFVDVYWADWHFWAFNVADAAITAGAILVFADLLFSSRHVSDSV